MKLSFCVCFFLFFPLFFFSSCQPASPEKSFDIAVLNSNLLVGFASDGMWRELESPSAKMGNTKDEVLTMQRSEVMESKIRFVEESFEKVKSLKPTDESKDMIQASLALYQYILPVYKTDYTQLAKEFDSNAPKERLVQKHNAIHTAYFPKFEALYNQLIVQGKAYAEKHHIPVKWAM